MKKSVLIFSILCSLLISSCVQNPVVNPSKEMISSSWKGTFNSGYHTDGIIVYWHLLKDGTMTGKWLTNKGSSAIDVEGTYQIMDGQIRFHADGTLVLYNKSKTKAKISGSGNLSSNKGSGTFKIQIQSSKFRNDDGWWEVVKI